MSTTLVRSFLGQGLKLDSDLSKATYNRPINHIAVSVVDVEASVKWYNEILGFELMGNKIHHIKRSEAPDSPIFGIYPENLQEVKLAYMTTGNGVGFELFEFLDPKSYLSEQSFEYHRGGFFHICVTDKDPDALAARIVESGGKRIGKTVRLASGDVNCLYAADPWGNAIEILDISFERLATMSSPEVR